MTKQLRKVFSILCAIALLISSLSMVLAEETVPAEEEAVRVAAEEEATRKAEEAAREAAEEAARRASEEEAARKAAEEAARQAAEEAARKAAEEEAARQAAEEAARKAAEEEAARQAAEEAACKAAEEADRIAAEQQAVQDQASDEQTSADETVSGVSDHDPDQNGDEWNDTDSEDMPETSDELNGFRTAELSIGQMLSDTLGFGEQLAVTLKMNGAAGAILKLYIDHGAAINTEVDGKAVGFTPADSDDPSMDLYVYEPVNAGRFCEIVLSSDEPVSFRLAAAAKQADMAEEPEAQEENPAEEENGNPAEDPSGSGTPAVSKTDEMPAPTVQVSMKIHDALTVGSMISDTLMIGQKAKTQVKCGKNPFVNLILNVNPDDVKVSIDGHVVQLVSAGNGTSIIALTNVAFRKFTVVISARKDLSFTLSAEADEEAAAASDGASNNQEKEEQPAEEPDDEENDEDAASGEVNGEDAAEPDAEENGEQTEASEEENAGETEEAAEENSAEETGSSGEENDEEENSEETEESVSEETGDAEENSEETADPVYTSVIVTAEEGADLYAEASRESEVTGHLAAGEEALVELNEEHTWGKIFSEDEEASDQYLSMEDAVTAEKKEFEDKLIELGYRNVMILNLDGADIYDSVEEEAAVIGHAEFESELWIKDIEAEGWAEIYTEEEVQQFIRLADIERQILSDEEMLATGYIKAVVATDIGANVYGSIDGDDIIGHLDAGTDLWVKMIEGAQRALIFDPDENAPAQYINLVDIIALLKPEGMGELPSRELAIHSSADGLPFILTGSTVTFDTELINFRDDDVYTVQWKYSADGKAFTAIEGANELSYEFVVDMENAAYTWKVSVILISQEKPTVTGETPETEPAAEDATASEEAPGTEG